MALDGSKTGSDTLNIPKLTETNYRSWSQQMRWILDDKGLLEIVLGTRTRPAQPAPSEAASVDETQYTLDLASYVKDVKKARSIIGATVSESVMVYIEGLEEPSDMWMMLERKYNPKSQVMLRQAVRSFTTVRKSDDIMMETHLQHVQRLKRRLEEQGEMVSNNMYIGILLNSVPGSEWEIAVNILESTENLTPEIVINRLLEAERKLHGPSNDSAVVGKKQALFTNKSNPKSKDNKSKDTKKASLKCTSCGKSGHVESDCWEKHPEKRPERKKEKKEKKDEKDQGKFAMKAFLSGKGVKLGADCWYLDSGASEHFSPYPDLFDCMRTLDEPCEITTAEGTIVYGTGIGTITINVLCGERVNILELHNVIFAPRMDSNLLSLTTLLDRGYEIQMHPTRGVNILCQKTVIANTRREGSLFRLMTLERMEAMKVVKRESVGLWHRRMGHLGEKNVFKLEEMAEGIKVDKETTVGVCENCLDGGQTRKVSREPRQRASQPLDLIHSDICGEISPTSLGGALYCVMFHDDATEMTHIYPMKTKLAKEMRERFMEYQFEVENQLGLTIKRLRTDGGGEYEGVCGKHLKENGIIHEITAPYTPDQNGVSERANRTVIQRVKAILSETKLPKPLWMELAQTVVYLKNRSPTRTLENKTPYEAWYGKKPDLFHLRALGTTAYALIPDETRTKLDFNTRKCQLVGYGGTNQYRLYDPVKNDVIISRNVVFDTEEAKEVASLNVTEPRPIYDEIIVQPLPSTIEEIEDSDEEVEDNVVETPEVESQAEPEAGPSQGRELTRKGRGKDTREKYDQVQWNQQKKKVAKIARIHHGEPQSLQAAINHLEYGKQWEAAVLDEYESLLSNDTWTLVELPEGRNAIGCKWVFQIKIDSNGNIIRFKVRLVALGCSQVYGVDYLDTYAPVAKLASVRILFAIAAVEDMEIEQVDFVTAFLGGYLEEEIYMEMPEGFVKYSKRGRKLVCKLRRAIYGLKQSARVWNRKLFKGLKKLGFQQTESDHCVWINDKTGVIIVIWVDDLLIFGKEPGSVKGVKADLKKEFEMKDLGEVQYFLGIQVIRQRPHRIHISQANYIDTILNRFGMRDCNPVTTPVAMGTRLLKHMDGEKAVEQRYYQQMVGSQMYSMMSTRADTAYCISQISQYSSAPNSTHEAAAKRGLRYLAGTETLGITYDGSHGLEMKAYCDADFAAGEDRRSISGMVITLAGGAVSWGAKKQSTVATSTTEAEYVSTTNAVKELIWVKRLLKELGREAKGQDVLFNDNQGAIALAHNPEYHARTKHIDIQHHFIRECVENGVVELKYCETKEMVADVLTKALPRETHWKFVEMMGMETVEEFCEWECGNDTECHRRMDEREH